MAEQTVALYKIFEGIEVGGLLANKTIPDHVNVDRATFARFRSFCAGRCGRAVSR